MIKKLILPVIAIAAVLVSCNPDSKKGATAVGGGATVESAETKAQPAADSLGNIVKVGDMAPDFTCTLTDGKQVTLSDLKGKVVMLQFTASWCGVCRKEMPFIEKDIWLKHKDNPNFVLMGIDRDEPLETVLKYADIFAKYALREAGITRNVLVDKEGKIVMITRLFKEDEFASLVAKIDSMLQ